MAESLLETRKQIEDHRIQSSDVAGSQVLDVSPSHPCSFPHSASLSSTLHFPLRIISNMSFPLGVGRVIISKR